MLFLPPATKIRCMLSALASVHQLPAEVRVSRKVKVGYFQCLSLELGSTPNMYHQMMNSPHFLTFSSLQCVSYCSLLFLEMGCSKCYLTASYMRHLLSLRVSSGGHTLSWTASGLQVLLGMASAPLCHGHRGYTCTFFPTNFTKSFFNFKSLHRKEKSYRS